jgi:hypothetical protein
MAYQVTKSNGTNITVNDGTINMTDTSLKLLGKNFFGYGEYVAENFVHLLEHFASDDEPVNPVDGQLWFDTTPVSNQTPDRGVWKYYFDGVWHALTTTTSRVIQVPDTTDVLHTITQISDGLNDANTIAIFSHDAEFTIKSNHPLNALMPAGKIGQGITLPTGCKFHGTATEALYADLAEMYTSDADYQPGTVVKIGGEAEVTQTTDAFCPEVFGIVSTAPAHLMNSGVAGVAVALEGRVPCRVIGTVRKGQRLVSSEVPGVARAVSDYERQEALDWYRIVGRALSDKTTEGIALLEVVVGTK